MVNIILEDAYAEKEIRKRVSFSLYNKFHARHTLEVEGKIFMTPEMAWDIIKFVLTVGASVLGSYWLFQSNQRRSALDEKKEKGESQNTAIDTANKALEASKLAAERALEEATARQAIEQKLDKVLDTLSGMHRLSVDFEMRDLLQNGRATIREGFIEVVKISESKIPAQV